MTDVAAERPDAYRLELLRRTFQPSSLDEVAEAVAVAREHERRFYVERVEGGYRWSVTHRGGGYPLLRITAVPASRLHADQRRVPHRHRRRVRPLRRPGGADERGGVGGRRP